MDIRNRSFASIVRMQIIRVLFGRTSNLTTDHRPMLGTAFGRLLNPTGVIECNTTAFNIHFARSTTVKSTAATNYSHTHISQSHSPGAKRSDPPNMAANRPIRCEYINYARVALLHHHYTTQTTDLTTLSCVCVCICVCVSVCVCQSASERARASRKINKHLSHRRRTRGVRCAAHH